MKLSKALKAKNKLVGEINSLKNRITANNNWEGDHFPPFDSKELYMELKKKIDELISLKTKIAVVNVSIYEAIFTIAELKGHIDFLRQVDYSVREGKETLNVGMNAIPIVKEYHSYLNKIDIQKEIDTISEEIEEIQDTLDTFNHTTEV